MAASEILTSRDSGFVRKVYLILSAQLATTVAIAVWFYLSENIRQWLYARCVRDPLEALLMLQYLDNYSQLAGLIGYTDNSDLRAAQLSFECRSACTIYTVLLSFCWDHWYTKVNLR